MVQPKQGNTMGLLEGIRILDLSQGVSGPFCTLMLADMGAEVIKVEQPGVGDIARSWGPPFIEEGMSAYFFALNRNKMSIALNLREPLAKRAFNELLAESDVLVENFRPGVMAGLGYSWENLAKEHPKLIYCSITGFGQDGPSAKEAAFDNIIQARSGLMSVTGERDGPPTKMGVPITDIGAGMFAAYAIMVALYDRLASGKGTRIDVSMLDTAVSWLCYWLTGFSVTGKEFPRAGNAHPTIVPYQVFDTKDGSVMLGVSSDRLWEKFASAVNRRDLLEDARFKGNDSRVRHKEDVIRVVSEILRGYHTGDFVALMSKAGVPCAAIQGISQVSKDPQLIHRGMLVDINGIVVPGFPIKMDSLTWKVRSNPPKLGEHTRFLLGRLGWTNDDISKLEYRNINSTRPRV